VLSLTTLPLDLIEIASGSPLTNTEASRFRSIRAKVSP
jgi:hypothetical protein